MIAILIPTYNRQKYLIKNLRELTADILNQALEKEVEIIVSNNASTDSTETEVECFIRENQGVIIKFYNQSTNIGLEANALFVLERATTTYVMYLGDDDFISKDYLTGVVNKLRVETHIHCILPSFQNIDYDGNEMGSGRDIGLKNKLYNSGFYNCLNNSYRGHQLSGLVLKRAGLFENYKKNGVSNLYPFIYFVATCCMKGSTWHFPEYPVLVLSPPQKDKDWDYNINGLITEIFDNYKKLPGITFMQRHELEFKVLKKQSWRYEVHLRKGMLPFLKSVSSIIIDKNTSFLTKIIFPSYVLVKVMKKIARKCLP